MSVTRTSPDERRHTMPVRAPVPLFGRPVRHPTLGVVLLALVAGAMAIGFLVVCRCDEALLPGSLWMLPFIVLAFALAERYSFHLEFQREALSFTLSEVPMALALVLLDPVTAIVVRLTGSLLMMRSLRRRQHSKLFFNVCLYTFEMALGFAVVHAVARATTDHEMQILVAVAVALMASSFAGLLLVSTAIAMSEGHLGARVRMELRSSGFMVPLSALIGFACVAPALVRPVLSLVTLIPIAGVWLLLQRHGSLAQRFRDLTALHGFSHAVGGTLDIDEIVEVALERATMLLRAASGGLEVYGEGGAVTARRAVGDGQSWLPSSRHDPAWAAVFSARHPVLLAMGPDGPEVTDQPGTARAMAIPIVDSDEVLGLLVLAERSGAAVAFVAADEASMEMLASQLSPALRKALMHASLEHAATHDGLTGDWNRRAFEQHLNALLVDGSAGGGAVMMLDLDKFKEVNDTLGHHVGDRVLVQFGKRVRALLRPDDAFARFGGDEFAIFARRGHENELRSLVDDVLTTSYEPLHLDDLDVVVTTSIGVALVAQEDRDAAAVLRRADIAMYAAKAEHAGFEIYREEIDRRTPERLSLLGELRDAIELGDLEVHYQPKVDLAAGAVIGAEALVRWHHPVRGWVPPDDFIALAEETGLIKRITDQVLAAALEALTGWRRAGHDLRVAVNLSTHDLLDELLAERIARRLERHGVAAERLVLEITESSLLADTPRTMTTIERLRRLGVELSLDDFGTGYSSLSYLRRLPVTELKVDRSFVCNLLLDKQDEVIVRSTIDLGHNLGMRVVAEGIENGPIMERLAELGCDDGQGYGISRPLPADMFEAWLGTTCFSTRRLAPSPRSESSSVVDDGAGVSAARLTD